MKKLLVAQSGGPTAAINSTLAGVLSYAKINSDKIGGIIGAINGIEGVLKENFIDITNELDSSLLINRLCNTPSSFLGSCRYKVDEGNNDIKKIVDILRRHNIGYFIYIGGNDSMDTVHMISKYCAENNIDDIKVAGAPKTIDNDLVEIDHCPGFGSAAKYVAVTLSEVARDCSVYNTKSVTIAEIMGRNAGWLTAAASLSNLNNNDCVDLIYLSEIPFYKDKFIEDIKCRLDSKDSILIAVSEGIKNSKGQYISEELQEDDTDMFGHKYISGVGRILESLVREKIGCKVRSLELNIMQRCSSHILSKTDIEEAKSLGMKACESVFNGYSGIMATLARTNNEPYEIKLGIVEIEKVANLEKKVPLDMINEDGNNVTDKMIEYLYPLIQGEVSIEYENGIPKHLLL